MLDLLSWIVHGRIGSRRLAKGISIIPADLESFICVSDSPCERHHEDQETASDADLVWWIMGDCVGRSSSVEQAFRYQQLMDSGHDSLSLTGPEIFL